MVLLILHHQHSSLVTVRQKAGLGLKHKLVWNYQVATSTGAKKGTATSEIKHASLKFNGHDAIVPGSYTANLTWNLTAATKDSSIKSE